MSIKYKQSWNEQMSTETPLLLPHYDWCNHCWMKKKVSHPITFLPCFSPRFNFRVSQVVPSIQAISTHSFPQIHDPNRFLNNSTLYFFYLKLLPARFWNTGLKTTVKEKKIQCKLFVYPIHMTTYLLCLIDSQGKKKRRSGGEIWREDGAQWDRGEQKAPQTRATQVRYCGTTGRGKGETRGQIPVFLHIKLTPRLVFCATSLRLQSQDTRVEAGIWTRHGAVLGEPSISGAARAWP